MMGAIMRLVVLIFFSGQLSCYDFDYYWREYTGEIPSDALVGGLDLDGHNVYIGQGYLQHEGLLTVHINPDEEKLYIALHYLIKPVKYVKILCGTPNHFEWVPTNSTDMNSLASEAVIGGHRDDHGVMYIGRISTQNGTKIGRINPHNPKDAVLLYVIDRENMEVRSFEVLLRRKAH